MQKVKDTRECILKAGKDEFLEKGYKDANMRSIASRAGVTTGAIYGYYKDKAALFQSLVEPTAGDFIAEFKNALDSFKQLPHDEQVKVMHSYSNNALGQLLNYIYDHFECFRLIKCCSAGTAYEDYIDRLVDLEVEATKQFIEIMKKQGYQPLELSQNMIHILTNAYFSTMFEIVEHNMEKNEADAYVEHISTFFSAGWDSLLKLP